MIDGGLIWRAASCPADEFRNPSDLPVDLGWLPSGMPATAASVLTAAGLPVTELDECDWWWQATLPGDLPSGSLLALEGIATVAEIWLGATLLHRVSGMFDGAVLPVAQPGAVVSVRVLALTSLLAVKRPRPRWKARLVADQRLRWFRTSLTGRMPGFLDGHPAVGPWGGLRLIRGDTVSVLDPGLSARLLDDGSGVVTVRARLAGVGVAGVGVAGVGSTGPAELVVGDQRWPVELTVDGLGVTTVAATVSVAEPSLWWPHTHGEPALTAVSLELGNLSLQLGRVGFRRVDAELEDGGFALNVNGCGVFARGACWSPLADDGTRLPAEAVEDALGSLVGAGLNMLRILGTTAWVSAEFLAACDRLGVMVWQDVPLAALDQPTETAFTYQLAAEVTSNLERLSGSPSLFVVCGGAETEQQAAMLGLSTAAEAAPLSNGLLPALVAASPAQLVYVANSPTGGVPAFRVDTGVAQYFGVGAYRRPLDDARRAGVRFAAECFAFAVPPHDLTFDTVDPAANSVPRDRGADWDFGDVTDHYAREFFGAPARDAADPERLRDLHSAAAAECLRALLSEWRRAGSSCAGALVISLRDVVPGAGWGLLDAAGRPKSTWFAARRAAAPLTLLHTDEGLNGLALHVVNDRPVPFDGELRMDLYAGGRVVETGRRAISVDVHAALTVGDVEILEGFRDVTRAYRFGPPSFDLVVGTLLDIDGVEIARTIFLPLGRSLVREPDLGLEVTLSERAGRWSARVSSRLHARSVVVSLDHGTVEDAWFDLLPGESRELSVSFDDQPPTLAAVRALNS